VPNELQILGRTADQSGAVCRAQLIDLRGKPLVHRAPRAVGM